MRFSYQARTKEGTIQRGFVEASSREAALSVLQKYGLYVTFLAQVKEPFWQKRIEFFRKISKQDIIVFTRQLSIMLKSSMPVVESLETIARQTKKLTLREMILKIAEDIEGGKTLSQAFSTYKKLFSPFYVGIVKSGEASGKVPESLDYLADYLEKERDFATKHLMVLIYPLFVLMVFFVVVLIMGVVVVPRFAEIFAGMESELPMMTRALIHLSLILKKWWPTMILSIGILCFSLFLLLKSKETKKFLDKASLEIPFVGDFFQKYFLARIALNLSTLISGGVPISQALEITGDMVGNNVYKNIILETREEVRAGQSISSVLLTYPKTFPPFFVQMVMTGEKTGHLEDTLKNVFEFYQKDIDRSLDAFVRLLEPTLIIFLGGLVALLALSLFVPLFQKGLTI